jgi:hypothetical protein
MKIYFEDYIKKNIIIIRGELFLMKINSQKMKLKYTKPKLEEHGDLEKITKGPDGGHGDGQTGIHS